MAPVVVLMHHQQPNPTLLHTMQAVRARSAALKKPTALHTDAQQQARAPDLCLHTSCDSITASEGPEEL